MMALTVVISIPASGQNLSKSILELTGASCEEELDESEFERFEALKEHPLKLNVSSRNRLISSGLFSQYQAASLIDYRKRCGPVLSYEELSLVDGFNRSFAEALKPFTDLSAAERPGAAAPRKLSGSLMVKSAMKKRSDNDSAELAGGWKLHTEISDRIEFNSCSRTTYSDPEFGLGTINLTVYGKGALGKIILGDYAARFGQGLNCWSGFSLSGYSTVQAFRKNGTGLAPSTSFAEMNRGLAADFQLGQWSLSAGLSLPFRNGSIANLSYCAPTWNAGISASPKAVSADFTKGFRNLSLFGETAATYTGEISAICGLQWSPSYGNSYALLGRYNCKGESGCAIGIRRKWIEATLDSFIKPEKQTAQCKAVCTLGRTWEPFGLRVRPSVRLSHRWKDSSGSVSRRTDLRSDLDLGYGCFQAHGRMNLLHCVETAWLGYAEAGYESDGERLWWQCYLRWTVFKVDRWDDRIYCYERDAPGSFNVPAYYGRGWAASAVAGLRSRHHALYARLAMTEYPWTVPKKAGTAECRLQYQFRF